MISPSRYTSRIASSASVFTDEPFFDPGGDKGAWGKRNQIGTFLIHSIQRPLLRRAMLADPGNLAQPGFGFPVEVFQVMERASLQQVREHIFKRVFHFALPLFVARR